MNSQTRALAVQAGIHFESNKENRVHSVSTETLTKFSALIAQDCVNIALAANAVAVAEVIKDQFAI
jgi:hypothetical protein